MCGISQTRYSCVLSIVVVAAMLLSAARAEAQTLAGGDLFSIILKSDGTVWTVGDNGWGQLGDNSTTDSKVPIQVSGLTGIVAVSAGLYHSMALTSAGNLCLIHRNVGRCLR